MLGYNLQPRSRSSVAAGFTLVEPLVLIAILAGMLLPAVQHVREAAGRAVYGSPLWQRVLAPHMLHDAQGQFPSAHVVSSTMLNSTVGGRSAGPYE
jgi:hypothetical protein